MGGFYTVGIGSANVQHAHLTLPGGLAETTVEAILNHFA
jgi:hypothetical protein